MNLSTEKKIMKLEKRRGQQGRLLHGVVVVVHKVHGVAVDVPEQLGADCGELGFRVPGRRPGHIPGVGLAEVSLQRAVNIFYHIKYRCP